MGDDGPKGAIGPRGQQGSAGMPGERGPLGPSGPIGPIGLIGKIYLHFSLDYAIFIGPSGNKGEKGLQGTSGPQGPPGMVKVIDMQEGNSKYVNIGSRFRRETKPEDFKIGMLFCWWLMNSILLCMRQRHRFPMKVDVYIVGILAIIAVVGFREWSNYTLFCVGIAIGQATPVANQSYNILPHLLHLQIA